MAHEFCDSCPGCRPASIDLKTGKRLLDTDPMMVIINRVWDTETTYQERKAFIEVCMGTSRTPSSVKLFEQVSARMIRACKGETDGNAPRT